MSEANKDVVRRLEAAWGNNDTETVDELLSDCVSHTEHLGGGQGLEAAKQANGGTAMAFPDKKATIEDIFAEGNKVVARMRFTGTNEGGLPWFGIPANGNKVDFQWISIYRVADGKVAEHWAQMQVDKLMQQLGAMPGM